MKIVMEKCKAGTEEVINSSPIEGSIDYLSKEIAKFVSSSEYLDLEKDKNITTSFEFQEDETKESMEQFFLKFMEELSKVDDKIPLRTSIEFLKGEEGSFYIKKKPCVKTSAETLDDKEITYCVCDDFQDKVRNFDSKTGKEREVAPVWKKAISSMDDLGFDN